MDNNQQHRVRALKRVIRRMRRREYEHRRVWLSRMNQALAPCPFCGSDAEIFAKYISPIDPFNLRALWVAGCPTCEVFLGADSIPGMVRLWNHRVYWLDPDSEPFEVTHYRGRGHSETLTRPRGKPRPSGRGRIARTACPLARLLIFNEGFAVARCTAALWLLERLRNWRRNKRETRARLSSIAWPRPASPCEAGGLIRP